MDYNELYHKYEKLLEENQTLQKENDNFRKQLELQIAEVYIENEVISLIETSEDVSIPKYKLGAVNNSSLSEEKINLFVELFKGRDDVYAKRWQNKEGKSGYSPICINEWVKGICDKPQTKCSECKNREYTKLDANAINRHLRGIEILGIFPMISDETCYFLAIDFDDEGWEKDISVIREICEGKNIPFAVERSRSGNGAHIWFFFNEKITAVDARRFGTALLTYAMAERHEIKFKSYDRLFPNQDTMPKGGLGNLIALPMQKSARKNKNSIFIDKNLEPYEDQWDFLSCIGKLRKDEIDFYISEFCAGNELGDLIETEDEIVKPWKKSRENNKFNTSDFPDTVYITKVNMIFISKKGFSNKALNFIKRMAAFKNPEFYKSQAMRLPIFDKPRVISLSEETSEYLCIPRGCEVDLFGFLSTYQINFKCKDETYNGKPISVEFNGQLRDEQLTAIGNMLKYEIGVLSATTAFGKTVIGAKLISERKVNTLIIVHTQQLLEQWKERLNQFLIINEVLPVDETKSKGRKKSFSNIGQIGAGKNTLRGIIDIATMQSLVKAGEVKDLVKDYGMVIVDECHHVSAFSFEQILKNVVAKYIYGLTATPIRKDGHQPIIFMQCGPIRYKVDARKQAEKRPFEHYIIPRYTPFRRTVRQDEKEVSITEIYSEISTSQIRNEMIIGDIVNCVKEGRNPIVLTERKSQVDILADALKEKLSNVIVLTGGMSVKEKKLQMEKLSNIPKDGNVVIVATGKFIGEGFDEPRLDTLFLAMPISWKGTLQQYAGRLHRLYENKNEVQIYDYVDIHVGVLERMYKRRLSGYATIGYSAKSDSKPIEIINSIYSNDNFITNFENDIMLAKDEVTIVSSYISKRRISQIIELLGDVIKDGIGVNIITRPETDFVEQEKINIKELYESLRKVGINIIPKVNILQKFIIIDQKIAWYGNISFLSYGNVEESIMRLESINIVNELMDTLDDKIVTLESEVNIQQKIRGID